MNISVVIPLYNEDESLPELTSWIDKVMVANNYTYEVLLIDDGSKDKSWAVIEELRAANQNIKGIKFQRNYGKSAALYVGFEAAQGDVVITMDADLQDSPEEIPGLYKMIVDEGYDLISGWKKKRYDPLSKTIPTKLFNWAARKVSGVYLHDFNCGLKSYRKDVIKSIEIYGEMHRYIPILSKRAGFDKIGERVVEHQARKYGTTKFGLDRFINGFLDLLSITFVSKYGQRPMHFFGLQGTVMFLIGFFMAMYLLVNKAIQVSLGHTEPLVANSPFFYIGLVTMVIGTQLFLAGFLGELISRKSTERNNYLIEKKIL
jgi:glycosyltransferase involved in cell wall biosynthesis